MKYKIILNLDENITMKTQIYDSDDKELYKCVGFKKNGIATLLIYVFSLFLLGIPWLILSLKKLWKIKILYKVSLFEEADIVMLSDDTDIFFVPIESLLVDSNSDIIKQLLPQLKAHSTLNNDSSVLPNVKINGHETDTLANPPTLIEINLEKGNQQDGNPMYKLLYFDFHFSRFYWDSYLQKFHRLNGLDRRSMCYHLVDQYSHGIANYERQQRLNVFGPNEIHIEVKSYFRLFCNEIISPFYIFQVFSVVLWLCDHYYYYASCIILITAISIGVSLYETKRQNISIRDMVIKGSNLDVDIVLDSDPHPIGSFQLSRTQRKFEIKSIHSFDLVPGDLISITSKGMAMPCDAVLISGSCIVNESVLTGESVPIIKTSIGNQGCDFELYDSLVHKKHTLYAGTSILLAKPPATVRYGIYDDNVGTYSGRDRSKEDQGDTSPHIYFGTNGALAVVVKTGFSTTKGQLVKSILHPNPLGFEFYKDSLRFVGVLACLAGLGMCYSAYVLYLRKAAWSKLIIRTLDVVTIVVPPSLPAAMTVGTVYAQNRLKQSGVFCISPPRINVCGNIDLACFDKTGTLTEDGLDFNGVVPRNSSKNTFEDLMTEPGTQLLNPSTPHNDTIDAPNSSENEAFVLQEELQYSNQGEDRNLIKTPPSPPLLLYGMASCHSLTLIDGVVCGDPLELKMFQATKWILEEPSPLLSPESSLLPTIVKPPTSFIPNKNSNEETIRSHTSYASLSQAGAEPTLEIGIIKHFTFSSVLQCMSVIVKILGHRNFDLFTKGSPEKIMSICNPQSVPSDYLENLKKYTIKGFRVIALAYKPLDRKLTWHHAQKAKREELEQELNFLGFLIMKNALKPYTDSVIHELINANIRPVMITGDNMLTAISVAHECGMIPYGDTIICVHAKHNEPIDRELIDPTKNLNTLDDEEAGPTGLSHHETPYALEFEILEKIPKPKKADNANNPSDQNNKETTVMEHKGAMKSVSPNSPPPIVEMCLSTAPSLSPTKNTLPSVSDAASTRDETKCLLGYNRSTRSSKDHNYFASPEEVWFKKSFTGKYRSPSNIFNQAEKGESYINNNNNYYFAMTGRTYSVMEQAYPDFLKKIMIHSTVFARMSPDNKTSLVDAYKELGYVVSMCGDGANDCGALKAADAGISLSDAESSVASPFTSKIQNITCVINIIKEGRCSLATSFGIFKFMALYSLIQFVSVLILYTESFNLADQQFLYIDLGIITTLAIFMGRTKPYNMLVKRKPPSCLMTFPNLLSIFSQLAIQIAFQAGSISYLKSRPWYSKRLQAGDANDEEALSWDVTVVFWISSFQYLFMAIVFSYGKPFRKPLYTNYWFLLTIVLITTVNTLLLFTTNAFLANIFMLMVGKTMHMSFRMIIFAFIAGNFILSLLTEELIIHRLATRYAWINHLFRHNILPYTELEKEIMNKQKFSQAQNSQFKTLPKSKFQKYTPLNPNHHLNETNSINSPVTPYDWVFQEANIFHQPPNKPS